MLSDLKSRLADTRQRQRWLRSVDWSARGWLAGAVVAIVLALIWRAGVGLNWWLPVASILAASGLAWLFGFAAPMSWLTTASSVDTHYDLKDRSSTAFQFAGDDRDDPLRKLQIADALARLEDIDPKAVAPWQTPKPVFASVGASLVMAMVMLLPMKQEQVAEVSAETRQVLLQQADYLDETMIEELRKMADENEEANEDVKKLVDQLEDLVEGLREQNMDQREALANLSMMQQAINESVAKFNLEQVDASMQQIASAMEPAKAMQEAAADMKAGDYDKAAQKLENLDPNKMSNKESRAVSENLKKVSKDLKDAKQGELSDATSKMRESLEKKDCEGCKKGACKLASLCKKQGLRKSLCQGLCSQLNRLSMCKGQCQGNKSGKSNSTAKSDSPKNTWGKGASNKPFGDTATNLDSSRVRENLQGAQGDGPSEREVVTSPEGEQIASRDYKKRYKEFRKQAEAVLDSEPLPLGHRQTVRRYFENIRPTGEELDEEAEL